MKYVVIVDQSDPPGSLTGISTFGPFDHSGTAERVMTELEDLANTGLFSVSTIAIASLDTSGALGMFIRELVRNSEDESPDWPENEDGSRGIVPKSGEAI